MIDENMQKIVAGAIFDFAAFLTGRDTEIKFGGHNDCSIMVDEIKKWATMRNLNLDCGYVLETCTVLHWND